MDQTIPEKLAELGLALPGAPAPAANYLPARRSGQLLFLSGQISRVDEAPGYIGRLGENVSIELGREAARAAALDVLSHINGNTDGRVGSVRQIVKLTVFVASASDFASQPLVADGASDLFVAVFGEAGRHARSAIGVAALPGGASVDVEATVELAG